MFSLLNADDPPSFLLIQEVPHYQIGLTPSLDSPDGTPVYGVPNLPGYTATLPPDSKHPRVATYVSNNLDKSAWTTRSDLSAGGDILTIDLTHPSAVRVTNVYNQKTPNRTRLGDFFAEQTLPDLPFTPETPWVVAGDFNRQNPLWTDLPTARQRRNDAHRLTTWINENGLSPIMQRDQPTRYPQKHNEVSSCIDLTLVSTHFDPSTTRDSWSIYAQELSDHGVITWSLPTEEVAEESEQTYRLDPSKREEWLSAVEQPITDAFTLPTRTTEELDLKAQAINDAMTHAVSVTHEAHRKTAKLRVPWWSEACRQACTAIRSANTSHQRTNARRHFRTEVRRAKRAYYSKRTDTADPASIWKWAKAGRGVRTTPIPSLVFRGQTATTNQEKGEAFAHTYFPPPENTPPQPRPIPTRGPPSPAFTLKELNAAISDTSNCSAPGLSGVGYLPLKWLMATHGPDFLTLFNDCLRLGYHPSMWRAARVVMLRKPNKKDPTSPRSYRPITLEETMGKLLEKIIANRLQYLANTKHWLPPNQFGGRQGHAVRDAAHFFLQLVEEAKADKLVASALAVDIQGFFDKVRPEDLDERLHTLHCPTDIRRWVQSFMRSRTVSLAFDGHTGAPYKKPDVGVPQGSPVSPILAAICAQEALKAATEHDNADILAYVDDHLVIVWSPSIQQNCTLLASITAKLRTALQHLGMDIEPEKSELIHFAKPRSIHRQGALDQRNTVTLTDAVIKPTITSMRWLGIWFDPALNFHSHVRKACDKATSTLAALRIVGNTERGLRTRHIRRLYTGCVLPVLTWGADVWYHGRRQKTLINAMQTVQDRSLRFLLGVYKGAQPVAMSYFSSILPISVYLELNKTKAAIRIFKTPHAVGRNLPFRPGEQALPFSYSLFHRVPTMALTPPYPTAPWSDPYAGISNRIHFHLPTGRVNKSDTDAAKQAALTLENHPGTSVLVYTDGSRMGHDSATYRAGAAVVAYQHDLEIRRKLLPLGKHQTAYDCEVLALAITPGWLRARLAHACANTTQVHVFSDSLTGLRLLHSHNSQPGAERLKLFEDSLRSLLRDHPDIHYHLHWCPGHAGVTGNEVADIVAKEAANTPDPLHRLPSATYVKEQATKSAVARWQTLLTAATTQHPGNPGLAACVEPPSTTMRGFMRLDIPRWMTSRAAQLLLNAGPFGGYFKRFPAEYRHEHHLPIHCRGHDEHVVQSQRHILVGCDLYADQRLRAWGEQPPPPQPSDWARDHAAPALVRFLAFARPFHREGAWEQERTPDLPAPKRLFRTVTCKSRNAALAHTRALARMACDGHPTEGVLLDPALLTAYLTTELGRSTAHGLSI